MEKALLLHGWGFDARVMQPLARVLGKDFSVKQIDVPGYTVSQAPAQDLQTIVDNISRHIEDRATLIGWSLGGNVAIQMASQVQSSLSALVLICCNPSFILRSHWPCALDLGSLIGLRSLIDENPASAMEEFAGWCAMGELSVKQTRRTLLEYMQTSHTDKNSLVTGLKILQGLDQRALLAGLDCRVLMLFADNDHLVPIAAADYCDGLSQNIMVQTIKNCGHGLPVSLPGKTAAAISAFI